MTSTDELIPNRGIYQRFRVGESQWKLTTYRFLRNPQGRVALLGLGVLAFLAIFKDLLQLFLLSILIAISTFFFSSINLPN